MVGALLLGMLVGYERSYNGRAAGMHKYGLVCMPPALTVFVGHASLCYGSATAHIQADPTHTIQAVVTGVGFLCAGVMMNDGVAPRSQPDPRNGAPPARRSRASRLYPSTCDAS